MARMDDGWFLVHRDDLVSFGTDGYLITVWVTLNSWANISPTCFKYGQTDITIKRGELITSIVEISDATSLDRRTVTRRIAYLKACGSIKVTQLRRGMKISIENYEEKQFQIHTRSPRESKNTSENENAHTQGDTQGDTQDDTHDERTYKLIKELNNQRRGGDARTRVIESPPPQISNLIGKGEIEKGDTPPEAGHVLSEHAKALKLRWLVRTQKYARMRVLNDSEVNTAIIEMAMIYSYPELSRILEYLESSPNSKAAKEFITPMDYRQKFFGGLTLLETVFIEATQTPEGKAVEDRKKAEAKELKKRRLEQEESAKRAAEDSRDRPKGWLKTIMQS